MGWVELTSANRHSECGNNAPFTFSEMLDANEQWLHVVNHVHWCVIDTGSAGTDIRKFRFKAGGTAPSDDMDIYISDTLGTGGDENTWGTAVATGVDITSFSAFTFSEVASTATTGRYIYFHINSTSSGSNFLGWGSNSNTVVEYWTGEIFDRFTTHINLTDTQLTTSSTSYFPTDGSLGMIEWDGSKYTNIINAYFEVCSSQTGAGVPNSAPTAEVQLFDITNSTQIASTSDNGSTPSLNRTSDISGNLPSGVALLDVRLKNNNSSTTATCYSARLIIVQETNSTTATKTRIYIPVGANNTGGSTIYTTPRSLGFSINSPQEKHYIWNDADFATVDSIKIQANIYATLSGTAFARLGVTSGSGLGEVSTTNLVPTLLESSDFSGSISDSSEYTIFIKNTTNRRSVNIVGAWIVVDLSNLTKYQSLLSVNSHTQQEETTGWIEDIKHQAQFDSSGSFFDGVTIVATHAATVWHDSDTNMQSAIYVDGVRNATSEVINSTGLPSLKESSALTIADESILTGAGNLNSVGSFVFGNIGGSGIYCTVTDINGAITVTRRIFII